VELNWEINSRLRLGVTELGVRAEALNWPWSDARFGLDVHGAIALGDGRLDTRIALAPGAGCLQLEARVAKSPTGGGWLTELTGSDAVARLTEDIPALQYMSAEVPLCKCPRPRVVLGVGYERPIDIVTGAATLAPNLTIDTDFTKAGTKLSFSGELVFSPNDHEVTFDVRGNYPGWYFFAGLAPESVIDLRYAFGGVMAPAMGTKSDLLVTCADLEGSVEDRSFQLQINTAGYLVFDVGTTELKIGEIDLALSYEDKAWAAHLAGTLSIGATRVELSADIGPTSYFACRVPRCSISEIARDVFGTEPPAALKDVTIVDFALLFSLGQSNSFSLAARSEGAIDTGLNGFGVKVERLSVAYAQQLSMEGAAQLTFAEGRTLDLSIGYGTAEGVVLKGDAKVSLPFADFIAPLADQLKIGGLSKPGDAEIRRVWFDLKIAEKQKRVAIGVEIAWGTAADRDKPANPATLLLVAQQDGKAWKTLACVSLPDIDLYALPLIGAPFRRASEALLTATGQDDASSEAKVSALQLRYASAPEPKAIAALAAGLDPSLFKLPQNIHGRWSAAGQLALPGYEKTFVFPSEAPAKAADDAKDKGGEPKPAANEQAPAAQVDAAKGGPAPAEAPKLPVPSAEPPDGSWVSVNKKFGIVSIARLGVAAGENGLSLMVDAGASFGPITLNMLGLGVTAPLSWPPKPSFDLRGVMVSCKSDAFTLAGRLMKEGGDYSGALIAKFGKVTLSAYGIYSDLKGDADRSGPSIAVFAVLDTPLGGPPAFFVTGLAGGLGYNRVLPVPTIEGVADHVLIKAASGDGSQAEIVTKLRKQITPAFGESWVALGIKFSSFKLVDSVALLTVSVGAETRISLLGQSTLSFPPKLPGTEVDLTIIHAELSLLADLRPKAGEFKLLGQLSPNSFLLHKNARLTGGFAFFTWFGDNKYAGDFALTLGGYHPDFKVPDHYPKVPHWNSTGRSPRRSR